MVACAVPASRDRMEFDNVTDLDRKSGVRGTKKTDEAPPLRSAVVGSAVSHPQASPQVAFLRIAKILYGPKRELRIPPLRGMTSRTLVREL
jgi:hypothetical protein